MSEQNNRYGDLQDPGSEVDDKEVKELAVKMGMSKSKKLDSQPEEDQEPGEGDAETSEQTEEATQAASEKQPEETAPVTIYLPKSVLKKLRRKAADKDCTVRYLILQAIGASRALKITVPPEDLVKDRRKKGGKR